MAGAGGAATASHGALHRLHSHNSITVDGDSDGHFRALRRSCVASLAWRGCRARATRQPASRSRSGLTQQGVCVGPLVVGAATGAFNAAVIVRGDEHVLPPTPRAVACDPGPALPVPSAETRKAARTLRRRRTAAGAAAEGQAAAARRFATARALVKSGSWSLRQESNLYLALRRRPFYPLNYEERQQQKTKKIVEERNKDAEHPSPVSRI